MKIKVIPLPKNCKKLFGLVTDYIISRGAIHTPDGLYDFTLETPVGRLHLSPQCGGTLVSIFTRFDDPKRAEPVAPFINTYSGKWNFHFDKGDNVDTAFDYFKGSIDKVLESITPSS